MSPAEAERILQDASRAAKAIMPRPSGMTAPLPLNRRSDEEVLAIRQAEEKAEFEKKQAACRKASNVPQRYEAARFDDTARLPADVVPKYLSAGEKLQKILKTPVCVAMVGPRGPGKTHLGCALINAFCDQARAAVYLDAMEYLVLLKRTYGGKTGADEYQVEQQYLKPELLVLDEMHERGDTAWEDRMLTRLVNKRYAAEKATLLISNQTGNDFKVRVGDSIADRIKDEGGIIVCDWPSVRGRI